MDTVFNFSTLNSTGGSGLQSNGSGIGVSVDPFDGQGNDFLNPDSIADEVNSVSLGRNSNVFGKHPTSKDILQITRRQINGALGGFNSIDATIPIFQGGNFALPVPDLGLNPSPFQITASSTFFANQIHPAVSQDSGSLFSSNPTAEGILFDVTSHSNALIGRQSIFNRPISLQSVNTGSGVQTYVPFNADNPVNTNAPIHGIPSLTGNPFDFFNPSSLNFYPGVFSNNAQPVPQPFFYPQQYPFGQSPSYSSYPNNLPFPNHSPFPNSLPFPHQNQNYQYAPPSPPAHSVNMGSFQDRYELVQRLIGENGSVTPDFVPRNIPGGVTDFLFRFPFLSSDRQDALKETFSNPTVADEDILAETGITSEGGAYEQGVVSNPFSFDGFLTDTNPFDTYNKGLVVTNGNGNGKVKGTEAQDWIFGNPTRSNIIDAQGGFDRIQGGTQADLINVAQGDNITALAGDDILFYNFDEMMSNPFVLNTQINAGSGSDTVVLTVDADLSDESNLPSFTDLGNGTLRVSLNGKHLYVSQTERFIVADLAGDIGAIFDA